MMAKLKELTKDQIIEAQKEKIGTLSEYGRKLKKQLKECQEDHAMACKDIQESYEEELYRQQKLHHMVLIGSIVVSLIVGLCIGFLS